jgi:hypothetical protein
MMKRWLVGLSLFFGVLMLAATATGCGGGGGSSSSDTNASSGKSGGTFRSRPAARLPNPQAHVFNQDVYSAFEYIIRSSSNTTANSITPPSRRGTPRMAARPDVQDVAQRQVE